MRTHVMWSRLTKSERIDDLRSIVNAQDDELNALRRQIARLHDHLRVREAAKGELLPVAV